MCIRDSGPPRLRRARRSARRIHREQARADDRTRPVPDAERCRVLDRCLAPPAPGSAPNGPGLGWLRQLLPDSVAGVLLLVGPVQGVARLAVREPRPVDPPPRLVPVSYTHLRAH